MDRKADQISAHFYTKLYYLVSEARETGLNGGNDVRGGALAEVGGGRLSGEGTGTGSGTVRADKWFNLSTSSPSKPRAPPFNVHVLVVFPDLPATQVVVSLPARTPLAANTREILLERWTITLAPTLTQEGGDDLPTVYKHGIPLFRGAWSLLRVLPAWAIRGRLRRLGARLEVRLVDPDSADSAEWYDAANARTHVFPSVPHPRGTLTLRAEYLLNPDFGVESRESVLSSHMRAGDDDGYADQSQFVPTLASARSSGGSSLNRLRRDSALSSSPKASPRTQSILTSSPRPPSLLSSSPRAPSLLSSSPRRPHPHPFKTDTLSGSLSSVNVGLAGIVSSSPLGAGGSMMKTSPPTIPHSPLAASSGSQQQQPHPPPARKRYSSSFGHRYSPSSGGRPLTPGSGSTHSSYNEKLASVAPRTDDDDLSDFVQDIDARKPLRRPLPSPPCVNTTPFPSSSPPKGYPSSSIPYPITSPTASTSSGLLMRQDSGMALGTMTSPEAVDAELGRMNDVFLKSLEGLGSGSTRQSRKTHERVELPPHTEQSPPASPLSRGNSLPRREPLSRGNSLHRRGVTDSPYRARERRTSNLSHDPEMYDDDGLFNY